MSDPANDTHDVLWDSNVEYSPVSQLNSDRAAAMKMMSDIQEIYKLFPHLDCGACGAPTCRAFAEDIVRYGGDASECIFLMRERIRELYGWKKENDGK